MTKPSPVFTAARPDEFFSLFLFPFSYPLALCGYTTIISYAPGKSFPWTSGGFPTPSSAN